MNNIGDLLSNVPMVGIGFAVASITLNATADVFKALGKTAPPWLAKILNVTSIGIHLLNGNTGVVTQAAPPAPKQ
jgi:hypothetical protein